MTRTESSQSRAEPQWENLKEKVCLEELDIDVRIILKWRFKVCVLD
jgi:hypothetical protein